MRTARSLRMGLSLLAWLPAGPNPGRANPPPLRIGWETELTGTFEPGGTACLKAAEMAEREVNDAALASQTRGVTLIVRDDASDSGRALALAAELHRNDQVDVLSGPASADTALAIRGYAETHAVPFLVPVAAAAALTREGTQETFRLEPDAFGWGVAAARFLSSRRPGASVGLFLRDFAVQRSFLDGFQSAAPELGLRVVDLRMISPAATDITGDVDSLKRASPDFVVVSGNGSFDATMTRSVVAAGFSPDRILHPYGSAKQIRAWGPSSIGSFYGTFFDATLPGLTAAGSRFVDRFRGTHGYRPGFVENYCYVAVHLLGEVAARPGGIGRDDVRRSLAGIDTTEVTTGARISFDHTGARPGFMHFMQVERMDGEDYDARLVTTISW